MSRRNISLPDDLDSRARAAGLNVSALARQAIVAELDRRARMARLDAWLDELDEQHGTPSARAMRAANTWIEQAVLIDAPTPEIAPRPSRTRANRGTKGSPASMAAPRRRRAVG